MLAAETPKAGPLVLGRYVILRRLSSGGMGAVHLAQARGPGNFRRLVAIKQLHANHAADPNFVTMFLDEAAIAARIDHPNVCAVYDFGADQGDYFLAMEFLSGLTLSAIGKAAVKVPELDRLRHSVILAKIFSEALEGIHAAHELRGSHGDLLEVVHRDIAPDNLFVTTHGVTKVMDFGIASARDRRTSTASDVLKGKQSYIAPERLHGRPCDRRVDIWAAGVVLWELVMLTRLFRRDSASGTFQAVLHDPIPWPSSRHPELDPALDHVLRRALDRDPDKRYRSAREFASALEAFVSKHGGVSRRDVAGWVGTVAPEELESQRELCLEAERTADFTAPDVAAIEIEISEPLAGQVAPKGVVHKRKRTVAVVALLLGMASVTAGVFGSQLVESEVVGEGTEGRLREPAANTQVGPVAQIEAPNMVEREDLDVELELEQPGAATSKEETVRRGDHAAERPDRSLSRRQSQRPDHQANRRAVEPAREEATPAGATSTGIVIVRTRLGDGPAAVLVHGRTVGRTMGAITLPAGPTALQLRFSNPTEVCPISVEVQAGRTVQAIGSRCGD